MKIIFFLCLLLALNNSVYSQFTADYQEHGDYLDVYDYTGHKVAMNGHSNLSGNPMLNETWGTGSVMFASDKQVNGIPLKFNIQNNKLYFKKDSMVYEFADKVLAFKLKFEEGDKSREVYFKSGYPDRRGDSTSFLYEAINVGPNVHFLKRLNSTVRQQYVYGSAAKESYIVTSESYLYNVKNKSLIKISNNKKSILKALPEYKERIEKFSSDNNVTFSNDKEINQLIISLNRVQ